MPAEWEPHEATWLSWPRRQGISFPGRYAAVPALWRAMVAALSTGERVHVNVSDDAQEEEVRALLVAAPGVRPDHVFLHRIPTDEPWCRDHGPTFVVRDAELALVDWRYNAWGGKYPPYDHDDAVPARIAALLGVRAFHPGIVMEGGALDVNGRGTVLTTESCLLNPNRNPSLGRAEIEEYLREYLNAPHVVWLGEGIAGDDTDGHVDDLSRFVGARAVVTVVEADPADVNYHPLRENLRRLRAARDQDGHPLEILELPMPGVVEWEGQRLPASYANFYVGNAVVLVPTFAHANDAAALAVLGRCFPGRRVVGIDSAALVWGRGAFHCATQQQPAVGAGVV
ncbi:MAG: agmatine deiminase family protein [Deltaproteobacteria bacterium]|nr:agmatine deiminase family protein [Deltaproteobacteria bacterium]